MRKTPLIAGAAVALALCLPATAAQASTLSQLAGQVKGISNVDVRQVCGYAVGGRQGGRVGERAGGRVGEWEGVTTRSPTARGRPASGRPRR